MMKDGILIMKINNELAERIIETRIPLGLFYVLKDGIYIGIDNSYSDAWTESFPNLRKCKRWLRNPNIEIIEAEEHHDY